MAFAGNNHVVIAIQTDFNGMLGLPRAQRRDARKDGRLAFFTAERPAHTAVFRLDHIKGKPQQIGNTALDFGRVLRRTVDKVLNILIPAFGKITGQVQFDLYHVYTTDEHTFKTLGFLYEDAKASQSRRSLLTAGLLHDIAKGQGGGHDKKGAAIAETICADLAMSGEETETTVWLVAESSF